MITELIERIQRYKVAVYKENMNYLDQEFSEIINQYSELINSLFSQNKEILETHVELLDRASSILMQDDLLVRSNFLEMEIEPIVQEVKNLEN